MNTAKIEAQEQLFRLLKLHAHAQLDQKLLAFCSAFARGGMHGDLAVHLADVLGGCGHSRGPSLAQAIIGSAFGANPPYADQLYEEMRRG